MNKDILFKRFPTLETERLLLTYFKVSHTLALFEQLNDPDVVEMVNDGKTFTMYEASYSINDYYPSLYQAGEALVWAMVLKDTGEMIGVRQCYLDTDPVTIQGWITREYRKQGYTTEAYSAILDLLKSADIKIVKAKCEKHNFKAINMLEKLGFEQEQFSGLDMLLNPRLRLSNDVSLLKRI